MTEMAEVSGMTRDDWHDWERLRMSVTTGMTWMTGMTRMTGDNWDV